MTLNQLEVKPDERAAAIGQSGSGKTFLSLRLIHRVILRNGNLALIDPKRLLEIPKTWDIKVYDNADKILREKPKQFCYRPKPADLRNFDAYDKVYRYCYNLGNIFVYSDDMVGIVHRSKWPDYLQICYQMGRQKKVAMLSAFQRPAHVPLFLMSEASKFYVFRLTMNSDIKRVHEFCNGYDPQRLTQRYSFMFQDINEMDNAEPVKLTKAGG